MQIGQLIGVTVFGTLYLSLVKQFPPHSYAQAHSSAHAIFTTMAWMVPVAAVGALAGTLLARTAVRARRPAATGEGPHEPVPDHPSHLRHHHGQFITGTVIYVDGDQRFV
jgi:hypothetical protein